MEIPMSMQCNTNVLIGTVDRGIWGHRKCTQTLPAAPDFHHVLLKAFKVLALKLVALLPYDLKSQKNILG